MSNEEFADQRTKRVSEIVKFIKEEAPAAALAECALALLLYDEEYGIECFKEFKLNDWDEVAAPAESYKGSVVELINSKIEVVTEKLQEVYDSAWFGKHPFPI